VDDENTTTSAPEDAADDPRHPQLENTDSVAEKLVYGDGVLTAMRQLAWGKTEFISVQTRDVIAVRFTAPTYGEPVAVIHLRVRAPGGLDHIVLEAQMAALFWKAWCWHLYHSANISYPANVAL